MARVVFALVAVGLIVWVISDHTGELEGASSYLTHIEWYWLLAAVIAEFGSIICFALVQQKLLEAGGYHNRLRWFTSVTLANIAISNSLPTGSVIATIFTYRQYRRRGADEVLAGWSMVALLVVTSLTLAILAAAGVGIAGSESSSFDLVGVTIGVLFITIVVAGLFIQRRALLWMLGKISALFAKALPRSRFKPDILFERMEARLSTVRMSPGQIVVTAGWGLFNWVFDCGCLVLSFAALGVGVPWRGLLLAYGAGQLAANLPITPGGLGVVEGSLVIALVAYGGAETSTVAAVFLYRLISFWGELPFGWFAWGWLSRRKKGERPLSPKFLSDAEQGQEEPAGQAPTGGSGMADTTQVHAR
ncbi:MAG: lysylphosphatidylglycerol synthase transmembrane domain-containing protein [Acidimicrobiales bacterium]